MATTPAPKIRKPRRDTAAEIAPSARVRSVTEWSPDAIVAAERAADSGNIGRVVSLCEWILGDDRVQGCLGARVTAFLELGVTFDAVGDKRRQSRAVRALDAGEDWDHMFPIAESKRVVSWGLMLGLGFGLQPWSQPDGHGGRDVPRLQFEPAHGKRWDFDAQAWFRQLQNGSEERIDQNGGTWLIHEPFGVSRPWSMGLWRGLAPWVLLKAYAIQDFGRIGETAARTVVEVERESGSTEAGRHALATAIKRMARNGSIVLPPGYHYKSAEVSATTPALYKSQVDMANDAIAIAIRSGNLSTSVKGGSLAAAESQRETGDDANKRSDAGAWENTTHDQTLTHWATSNFADARLAPWPHYATEEAEDRSDEALTLNSALDGLAKAKSAGFVVDEPAFLQKFALDTYLSPAPKDAPVIASAPEAAPPDAETK